MRKILVAAVAVAALSTPALAQTGGSGLVAVNVQNVDLLKNFLNGAQVSVLDNVAAPITVNVPVGVAATVCDVSANVLAQQAKNGGATCDAKNGSAALTQNAIRQLQSQSR